MTTKPTDLIAIANPNLARKLAEKEEKAEATANQTEQATNDEGFHKSFRKDIWKAVFILNIMRYGLALFFLLLLALPYLIPGVVPIDDLIHPSLFLAGSVALIISAVCFTVFTKTRRFALEHILVTQFATDLIITALLVHATGSISSSFSMLFFMIVTTGSVVLKRKHALALASGAIILLFYEHIYSIFISEVSANPKLGLMASYGILLMFSAWVISYMAQKVRAAERRAYIPNNESIEEYLVREEIRALKSALASTDGNKTEAAKLLGMTFRSFRYKLTKYEIS
jgi:hypothetical protein